MTGFSVIDLETTGLSPAYNHRIVEVAVVQLNDHGDEERVWTTLVNPQRDIGATHIHGISARDIFDAPTFGDIAGQIVQLMVGRVPVAHNLPFDARFLSAEFTRIGAPVAVEPDRGLCTMSLAGTYLASTGRSLASCCASIGHSIGHAHTALDDARASGRLLAHYLRRDTNFKARWQSCITGASGISWPRLPTCNARCVVRAAGQPAQDTSFLSRLVSRAPRPDLDASAESYLALLDRVLMDRNICRHEEAELISAANMLGLSNEEAILFHQRYLAGLAQVARSDGIVTPNEEADLLRVAQLLGLPDQAAKDAMKAAESALEPIRTPGTFALFAGAKVVFTGEAPGFSREEMEAEAVDLGLRVMTSVSKKTTLVVVADPDSLSSKARKARELGIPMIDFPCYLAMIAKMR